MEPQACDELALAWTADEVPSSNNEVLCTDRFGTSHQIWLCVVFPSNLSPQAIRVAACLFWAEVPLQVPSLRSTQVLFGVAADKNRC